MATQDTKIIEKLNNFTVQNNNEENSVEVSVESDCAEYGLPLKEVYKLAYNFYKGKNKTNIKYFVIIFL